MPNHIHTARAVIAIAVAAAVSAPAVAAADMFLQLGPAKGESADSRAARGKVELSSFTFSASRKGWDGTIKGKTHTGASDASAGAGAAGADKFGAVSGAHRVADVGAEGMPTGKRQHGSVTISKPLEPGSITMTTQLTGCAVGTLYESAEVTTPDGVYALADVEVASCGDEVTLDYAKVKVRGWNPETKEE